jgi:hypothetical protein
MRPGKQSDQILTSGAANSLGISKRMLNLLVKGGKVPAPSGRTVSGYHLWTLKDIEAARMALEDAARLEDADRKDVQ